MFDGAASEQTEARRSSFLDLLDAVAPLALDQGIDGRTLLGWRVEAKLAQAELMQRSVFGTTEREKRHALRLSQQLLTQCTGVLMG